MRKDLKSRYGDWCLIAGAAEGLGEAYASALAQLGINLIMVDLQKGGLESLAKKLKNSHGIQIKVLNLDLASETSVEDMMQAIRKTHCRLLIYNAAFSKVQKFLANDSLILDRYIQVNARTPLQLTHSFCQFHKSQPREKKGILLMSSLAGSWGTQLLAPYGGTKAFNHILAESLYYELKHDGFDVLACVAGATSTPAYLASLPAGKKTNRATLSPEKVCSSALEALGNRPFVIPGTNNKLTYFFLTRILPRRLSLWIMNKAVGSLYENK